MCNYLVNRGATLAAYHENIMRYFCLVNLPFLPDHATKLLDESHLVKLCHRGLSKPFELVSHDHLDNKLEALGINGRTSIWVKGFPWDGRFTLRLQDK